MTVKERWTNWHWTTRTTISVGLLGVLWVLVTALFVPRREYERDNHLAELRYVRDSSRRAAVDLKIERYIDFQNCKRRRGEARCLDPDRP